MRSSSGIQASLVAAGISQSGTELRMTDASCLTALSAEAGGAWIPADRLELRYLLPQLGDTVGMHAGLRQESTSACSASRRA